MPPIVTQRIELFNYDVGTWEQVDERTATTTDTVVVVTIDTNADRFIEPGTRSVEARLNWFDPGALFSPSWSASIDQATWFVTP